MRPAATVAIHPGALSRPRRGDERQTQHSLTRAIRGGGEKEAWTATETKATVPSLRTLFSTQAAARPRRRRRRRRQREVVCPLSFLPPFSLSFRGPSSATHSPVWKGRRGGGGGGGGGTHSGSPRKSVSFLHLALGRFWRRRRRPRSKAGQGGFWAVSSAFPLIYSTLLFLHSYA